MDSEKYVSLLQHQPLTFFVGSPTSMELETISVICPYCGEKIEVDIEPLDEVQTFIEDCRVCCRPIQLEATLGEEGLEVVATRSD